MKTRTAAALLALLIFVGVRLPAATTTFPVDELKAGMVGVGRTVFQGSQLEDFKVHILGVLRNVIGTRRNLILAKLEGGPLADTGVIAGMSGSPVYIDGRLVGAVSYSLGANNIGLIYGTANGTFAGLDDWAAIAGFALLAVLGTALLGRGGVTGTVGDRMLVLSPQGVLSVFVTSALVIWIGTQFAVPISIGQCVLGGMFGAAYAKSVTVVNKKIAVETVSGWVVVPVAAFILAYFASAV